MKTYRLNYIQNNTKECIEIVYINTTLSKIKKDFKERIQYNNKTYIHYGTEELQ
jgi:hypothetical protein